MKYKIKALINKYEQMITDEKNSKHYHHDDEVCSKSKIDTLEDILIDLNSILSNEEMYEVNKAWPPR